MIILFKLFNHNLSESDNIHLLRVKRKITVPDNFLFKLPKWLRRAGVEINRVEG
jgi:hypothetical protein